MDRPHGYVRCPVPPSSLREDGAIVIPLTHGFVAIVDPIDGDLAELKWMAKRQGGKPVYAVRMDRTHHPEMLHRVILTRTLGRQIKPHPEEWCDHGNGDSLDNRRSNLRLATSTQNAHNRAKLRNHPTTSQYKGVYWDAAVAKWRVSITHEGRRRHIGRFADEVAAAIAYDDAAARLYASFARLNFPARVA